MIIYHFLLRFCLPAIVGCVFLKTRATVRNLLCCLKHLNHFLHHGIQEISLGMNLRGNFKASEKRFLGLFELLMELKEVL